MKEMSGRKFATVAMISTYCIVIIGSLALALLKLISVETFLALLSGLGSLVMYITKAYFDDKDRSLENTKGGAV